MTEVRAVCDTNIFVAAALSRNPTSPTQEVLDRWQTGEFVLLVCQQLAEEIAEKLLARQFSMQKVEALIERLLALAEWVLVPTEAIEPLLPDPDDNVVLACALLGEAHYLVTYDPHFAVLGSEYRGLKIVKALPFLWVLRGEASRG